MSIQPDAGLFLNEAAASLSARISSPPSVALILGSGLGEFAGELENPLVVDSTEIPHYPQSSVKGHVGKLVFGTISTAKRRSPPLLVFQGRVHYYERGNLAPVVFPVQLAQRLGATTLIVTNAAGGIRPAFKAGDFMLIDDFISFTFLRVPAVQRDRDHQDSLFGRGFGNPFDERLQGMFLSAANKLRIGLSRGVYCWLKGPSYETAAEIEMLRRVGADAVGMSTVPEVGAAHELGMRIAAISLISNMATGIANGKLSHEEVTETAERIKPAFTSLMREVLLLIGERMGQK